MGNNLRQMQRKRQATFIKSSVVAGEHYNTYVPKALPPVPAINMAEISEWLEKANFAIGELNGIVESVPDPAIINYMYVRKEAVLSSQIEGTQSTLDDLLRYESDGTAGVPVDDVNEVSSYVAALCHGLERLQGGFPLSFRLVREVHKILLTNSRGHQKTPGIFRKTQNWIGGTRPGNAYFVPPPPEKVLDCLGNLEKFMHAKNKMPILVKAALIHHQFETIHPFLDGNGRAGRLLITLYLYAAGFLRSPFLYLSLFFRQHRELYYDKLSEPRKTGNWEEWLNFFLEGTAETAWDAKRTLLEIKTLFTHDDARVSVLGRAGTSAKAIFFIFKQKPILNIAEITKRTGLTKPTAISIVKRLIKLGIVENISEKKWGQVYAYSKYIG
ncbi:MAG: Fic family protein, partial [Treponema sp.]|nr:Fic family protein [Treponema sp.]